VVLVWVAGLRCGVFGGVSWRNWQAKLEVQADFEVLAARLDKHFKNEEANLMFSTYCAALRADVAAFFYFAAVVCTNCRGRVARPCLAVIACLPFRVRPLVLSFARCRSWP
jgi:hypothetical protein